MTDMSENGYSRMVIARDLYLNQLIAGRGNGLIKVVTGIRRCGKSYLLFKLFYDYLVSQGVGRDHIIDVALDDYMNEELREPHAILRYVREHIVDGDLHYVLLDEVQLIPQFHEVLNSLLHVRNVDISFKKIIVVKDDIMPKRDDRGIVTMGILDFLLNSDSLDY